MVLSKTQDLPPPGGYKPINFKRIPAKTYFNGATIIAGYLGMTAGAAFIFYLTCKQNHHDELERRSSAMAITPLLLAERDRELLKQIRKNRDEEANLMKNVEGWKVGTWYGEPIFHTQGKDYWLLPRSGEYYVHTSESAFNKRFHFSLWS